MGSPPATSWTAIQANEWCQNGVSPEYRSVGICLPMKPFKKHTIVTTICAFIDTADGVVVVFDAPRGCHWTYEYRVLPRNDGGLAVQETVVQIALALLKPYNWFLMNQAIGYSHKRLGRLLRELEEVPYEP